MPGGLLSQLVQHSDSHLIEWRLERSAARVPDEARNGELDVQIYCLYCVPLLWRSLNKTRRE